MTMQGKNTGNPDGLPSILTWQRPKLTFENRGSDSFCHPKVINMDYYSETAVKYKLTANDYLKIGGIVAVGLVIALLSFMYGGQFFVLLVAADIYGMYYFISRFNCEYEYIVTNGELDADKIIAKSRRKRLANVKSGEFLLIAPYSEKYQHQINSCVRKINAPKGGTHFAIYQKSMQKNCIFFTPDGKTLENLKANVGKGVYIDD